MVTRWILAAVLLVGPIGCEDEAAPVADTPAPAAPEPAPKPEPPRDPIIVREGLAQPESALHDTAGDVYLVSNIDGKPLAADGKGFISRVSPEGQVLALKWIGGPGRGKLNAPKGMAIANGKLYVADIDTLRLFDAKTGAPGPAIKIKGATFLNDVTAAPDGTVYVSDTGLEQWGPYVEPKGNDAIYRIEGGKAVPLIQGKELGNPNGLLADGDGLWVVNKPGELFQVSADGKRGAAQKTPKGTLDEIVRTPKGLVISSWQDKAIYLRGEDGSFSTLFDRLTSPADIGYDAVRNRLLIPLLTEGALHIQPL